MGTVTTPADGEGSAKQVCRALRAMPYQNLRGRIFTHSNLLAFGIAPHPTRVVSITVSLEA